MKVEISISKLKELSEPRVICEKDDEDMKIIDQFKTAKPYKWVIIYECKKCTRVIRVVQPFIKLLVGE